MEDDLTRAPRATDDVLDGDDVAQVLSGAFYLRGEHTQGRTRRKAGHGKEAQPSHYKVICISLYNEDLEHLDQMVETLKSRGFTKANRSALIRVALEQVDLGKVKRGL
jgi:hypothetical protein